MEIITIDYFLQFSKLQKVVLNKLTTLKMLIYFSMYNVM